MLRVQKVVINPAVDHVNLFQTPSRTHEDVVIHDHEVRSLHELDPHFLSQKRVLEIGRVINSGRQQDRRRRLDTRRRTRQQRIQQSLGVVIHRNDIHPVEQTGKRPFEHLTIFQNVRDPRWTPEVIFQYVKFAVATSNQIHARDMTPSFLWRMEAHHLFAIGLRAQHQVRGNNPVSNDLLIVVQIVNEKIQSLDALLESFFNLNPLLAVHDSRKQIERPNFLCAFVVPVNGKRDSEVLQQQLGTTLALQQLLVRKFFQTIRKRSTNRPWLTRGSKCFVITAGQWRIR